MNYEEKKSLYHSGIESFSPRRWERGFVPFFLGVLGVPVKRVLKRSLGGK